MRGKAARQNRSAARRPARKTPKRVKCAAIFLERSRVGEIQAQVFAPSSHVQNPSSFLSTNPARGCAEDRSLVVNKTISRKLLVLGPLAALLLASSALAEEAPPKVGTMVVTAARGPQPHEEVLADLSVLEREDIELSGAASLADLLRGQAGVEITNNGGPGTASGIFLRGANAGHTLVLVDGVRVDSSTLGATALEALPLAGIERIEILRGPASSLYGADALGGVIQLFTRRGDATTQGQVRFAAGDERRREVQGSVSGSTGAWSYSLALGREEEDGFSAIRAPGNYNYNPDRDGYRREQASGQLAYRFGAAYELAARAWQSRLQSQFDAGLNFDDRTRSVLQGTAVDLRGTFATNWRQLLRVAQSQDDSTTESAWGRFRVRTRQQAYLWQNDLRLPLGELQVALERREERVDSNSGYALDRRDTDSLTMTYRLQAGSHGVQAGLRHDDSSQYGGEGTGSLSYAWRFTPAWRLSAGAGTAFKAPGFNDLYYPGFGNPQLRPEVGRNVEVGLGFASGAWEAKALAYRNRVEDLIVVQCDLDFNCAPFNVARATLSGLGLRGAWQGEQTRLAAHLDLQRAEDADSGLWLPRRARQHGGISITQQRGPWRWGAQWLASGPRFEDTANRRSMAGYGLLNLSASYKLGKRWSLLARLNNALDRDYELAKDYATAGRHFFLAVQYRSS